MKDSLVPVVFPLVLSFLTLLFSLFQWSKTWSRESRHIAEVKTEKVMNLWLEFERAKLRDAEEDKADADAEVARLRMENVRLRDENMELREAQQILFDKHPYHRERRIADDGAPGKGSTGTDQ